MFVFPAVDILHGQCVQLVQGDRAEKKEYGDPVTCAMQWLDAGAEGIHVVNLDGAFGDSQRNSAKIAEIIDTCDCEIQLGGGIRSIEDAINWLNLGVDRIIISTFAVANPDAVTKLANEFGKERIVAGIDAKKGRVVVDGWVRDVGSVREWAACFSKKGAGMLLYTNVDVEGLCKGIEIDPIDDLMAHTDLPLIVSGGITSTDDVRLLENRNIYAIVLGSALYSGILSFEQAKEAAQ
jgi:phosphoribosylformimino-5-aminoimidazole carboxamide ribotide isomerase